MRGTCSRHRGIHLQRASCVNFNPRSSTTRPQIKPEIKPKEQTPAEKLDKSEPNTDKKN